MMSRFKRLRATFLSGHFNYETNHSIAKRGVNISDAPCAFWGGFA